MEGFFLGVLAASFLGSLHCVGMCGVLVGLANGRRASGHALYQGGRLATLLVLGAIAGSLGVGVDALGELAGLQRVVAVASGVFVIVWGLIGLIRGAGWHVPAPAVVTRTIARAFAALQAAPPMARSLSIGLLTPLLPCGWLALFVITAAGTAHPGWGALTLAVFWVGNVPALLGVGVGLRALGKRLGKRMLPLVSGAVLVLMGVLLLTQRASFDTALVFAAPSSLVAPVTSSASSVDPTIPLRAQQEGLPCCASH